MVDLTIALAGNPNAGKTSIFNALTGSHQHVGNWPGKTVEKKEGIFRYSLQGIKPLQTHYRPSEALIQSAYYTKRCQNLTCRVIDLPGVYSLSAYSPEEVITRDYLLYEQPDVVINVVDASNLERNLYLTVQLLELGAPLIIALNVVDIARARGLRIDQAKLSTLLGYTPIVETVGNRSRGIDDLLEAVINRVKPKRPHLKLVA